MLCQLQFKQGADQFTGFASALLDQALQVGRIVTHQAKDVGVCLGSRRHKVDTNGAPARETDFFEHILSRFDQLGAVAYQPMATFGEWRVNRARHREHLAAVVGSQPRGDQGS